MTRQISIVLLVTLMTVLFVTFCESRHQVRVARQSKVPASFDHAPQHLGNRLGGDSIVPKLKCSCTYVRDYAEEAMTPNEHKVNVEIDGNIEDHKRSHMMEDAPKTEETQVETEPSDQKSAMQ